MLFSVDRRLVPALSSMLRANEPRVFNADQNNGCRTAHKNFVALHAAYEAAIMVPEDTPRLCSVLICGSVTFLDDGRARTHLLMAGLCSSMLGCPQVVNCGMDCGEAGILRSCSVFVFVLPGRAGEQCRLHGECWLSCWVSHVFKSYSWHALATDRSAYFR